MLLLLEQNYDRNQPLVIEIIVLLNNGERIEPLGGLKNQIFFLKMPMRCIEVLESPRESNSDSHGLAV